MSGLHHVREKAKPSEAGVTKINQNQNAIKLNPPAELTCRRG